MMKPYKQRFHRLMRIVMEVKTDPRQKVSDLLKKLSISRSQFYKDRQVLSDIGFQFDYSRGLKKFVITQDITLPVENLTLSEQLSLVMALRHLSAAGDHILTYEGFKAAKKIASQLPGEIRERLFEDLVLNEGFRCDPSILEKLQRAVGENWRIVLTYQRPGDDAPVRVEIDPYHIFFKRRAIYVEGFSVSSGGIRTYRLSRIKTLAFKEKGFAVREDYDFGKRYRNAFSAFPGEQTEHVVVWISRKTRPYIEESMWHHSQRITQKSDGAIIFEVDVAEPREVMWWSFFWGDNAKIIEPDWLREEARRIIEKMNRNYE